MTVLLVNESTLEEVVKGGSGPVEGLREVSLCHFFSGQAGFGDWRFRIDPPLSWSGVLSQTRKVNYLRLLQD